jgi:FkbM family methyltransferase
VDAARARRAVNHAVKQAFAAAGLEVSRRRPAGEPVLSRFDRRRDRLMRDAGVDVVLDVGASRGYYGLTLRAAGYRGRIVSFEPLPMSFATLEDHARGDASWSIVRTALGVEDGEAVIHVAGNAVSSSLLPMAERHVSAAPEAGYVADETVPVSRLDSIAGTYLPASAKAFLKLDVQGYEDQVLLGAGETLGRVVLIESELSLCHLYGGQMLCVDMIKLLAGLGFDLVAVEDAFVEQETGRTLQIDGIFARRV